MKTPVLSACFAVAAVAATAALTDPAEVAAKWNDTFKSAREPFLQPGPLGLAVTPPASLRTNPPVIPLIIRPKLKGDVLEVPALPPGWQLDPGFVHGKQSDAPPPGAKPWYYRGQKFWLIPIAVDENK